MIIPGKIHFGVSLNKSGCEKSMDLKKNDDSLRWLHEYQRHCQYSKTYWATGCVIRAISDKTQQTDGPIDRPSSRDAMMHFKNGCAI